MGDSQHVRIRAREGGARAARLPVCRARGDRVARPRAGAHGRRRARHRPGPRLVRRAARRPRGRRGVQPAAQPPPRAVDDQGARGRQARAVREADRADRRGGRDPARRGAPPPPAQGHGGVHVPAAPAVAAHGGDRAGRRGRRAARRAVAVLVLQCRSGQHPQPGRRRRRRADGHRLLRDLARPAGVRRRAAPRARPDRARSEVRDRPAHRRRARFRRAELVVHRVDPAPALPARPRARHRGPDRARDPVQRAARPGVPDLAPARRADRRDRVRGLRPVHDRGRRVLAGESSTTRRCRRRSTTRSPTCG